MNFSYMSLILLTLFPLSSYAPLPSQEWKSPRLVIGYFWFTFTYNDLVPKMVKSNILYLNIFLVFYIWTFF